FLPELVAYFSNYARTGVIALIITGVYATWLQVGSLEALLHTAYGQALLVKLALFMPLLAIAGINLVYTQRGIRAGKSIWTHRLRRLVALEIALIIGMLAAVGVMTAISPARSTLAARKAIHETPTPFNVTQSQRGLTVNLVISSTWTGENTFDIHLSSASGEPITDASLIRLRFTHQNENSGESELNPVHTADGIYSVSGANLSFPGDWQIRTTIQRPNEFDTVMDFKPEITNRPAPREIDTTIPIKHRVIASLMTGITLLMIGVVMLSDEHRARQRMIAVPLLAASGVLLIMSGFMASQMQNTESVAIASDYSPAPTAPIRVVSLRDSDYPLLIRADGIILEPDANGIWRPDNLKAAARDAYLDTANRLWVATDSGLYVREAETWRKINDLPSTRLTDTHGYLFASGSGAIARLESGMKEIDSSRLHSLDVPESDQPAGELVMLGNHTHVLQNGTDVFQTEDLGLGWKPLNAPDDVQNIITGRDGNLIISTSKGLLRWTVTGRSWEKIASLPDDYLIDEMQLFQDQLYALAGGRLYHNQGSAWQAVSLPDSENAYITTTAIQNMIRLWVLDSEGLRLWSSDDGVEWKLYSITMRE
ncbi:MAG TPA: CopD family protein, partial [Aggregatilineales bacterium]|nr:CopD family protein [Aggregatilineales bacterium]